MHNLHDQKFEKLINIIKSGNSKVVLLGAGNLGKLSLLALRKQGITVHSYCDNNKLKQGKLFSGLQTISMTKLLTFDKDTHVFMCNNYLDSIIELEINNFKNIYNCIALLENADFTNTNIDIPLIRIKRDIALHKSSILKTRNIASNQLIMKSLDVVITERCSLKCKDCANLMQYYREPVNTNIDVLFNSLDRFMQCVDWLCEFRVIGGEPFMNPEFHKVVTRLLTHKHNGNIIIYTNGTIIPRGKNLECLKNERISLDVANYGMLSKNHDKLIKTLETNDIIFNSNYFDFWTNSGQISFSDKSENELSQMFKSCCVNDMMTLLHGVLYRCPFSAHAINIRATQNSKDDVVDIADESLGIEDLKNKIINLYNNKKYLTACSYCNGRDYTVNEVKVAEQVSQPLQYHEVN